MLKCAKLHVDIEITESYAIVMILYNLVLSQTDSQIHYPDWGSACCLPAITRLQILLISFGNQKEKKTSQRPGIVQIVWMWGADMR